MTVLWSIALILAFCSGVWIGVRIEREQNAIDAEFWDGTYRDHGFKHKAGGHKQ